MIRKKLRIGVAVPPALPVPAAKYGAVQYVVSQLIRGLVELGHEVTLFGPGDSQVPCEVVPVCPEALGFRADPDAYRRAQEETERQIGAARDRLDIVHAHDVDMLPFADRPTVTTLHGPLNLYNLEHYRARRHLPLVSISDNQRQVLPELDYVRTVYHGLDPEEYPFSDQPGSYLLFIGRIGPEKMPHEAIELALAAGLPIKVAGPLDLRGGQEYFDAKIAPYLRSPLVTYVGEVGYPEKLELYRGALCNLHPVMVRESFGLTVLEAAYCGVPTLATRRGSLPELVEEGITGAIVEDMAEGWYRLPDCLALDRARIARRARQRFHYRKMAQGYVEAYREVLADPAYAAEKKSASALKLAAS